MYCNKCGKEINDEAVICVHCGSEVNNGRRTEPSNSSKVIVSVILIIASISIIALGAILSAFIAS